MTAAQGHMFAYHGGYGAMPPTMNSASAFRDVAGLEVPDTDGEITKMMNAKTYEDMCTLVNVVRCCFSCQQPEIAPDDMLTRGGAMAPTGKLQRCTACGVARYCCRACQRAHWPEHKKECAQLKAASASES
mmetsp:Transcript_30946/g.79465  ORF Transcript_30946/g.79465 Transcript_30946/m.79465 type:complete len:131 (+) Transcript_30946:92-484(+)